VLVDEVIARIRQLGAVAVRKMDGIEEIKFPLPKGLKIDAATGLEIEVRKAPETGH
jgi:4-hydroxy-3-methylbut-2-enyl diphosphate reductase